MSDLSVFAAAGEAGARPALVRPDRLLRWADLAEAVRGEIAGFPSSGPLPTVGDRSDASLLRILGGLEARRPLFLLHPAWTEPERRAALRRLPVLEGALAAGRFPDLAAVVHTSGSSGAPKGLLLSRSALLAAAAASEAALGWEEDDRWLLTMTPAHVGGLSVLTRCLAARRAVVVAPPGRFDGPGLLDLAEATGATLLSLVPAMLAALLDAGRPPPPELRAALLGGAAASPALLARARRGGWPILTTWGATETCAQAATERPGAEPGAEPGVGPPLPGVEVAVRDGTLRVGGPTLASAVLDERGLRPLDLDADGRWDSGDLGAVDERGRVHVFGRRDDRFVSGGENVDPLEVEAVLATAPGVREAVVVGLPDPRWGHVVGAVLLADPGGREAAEAAAREQLASYKRPRAWRLVPELPRTPSGKPDRRAALRAWLDEGAR